MTRNRSETETRLYQAFRRLLEEEGFEKVGINAIAKEAGADKNLVYRYFGGLEGLLLRYAEEGDFFAYDAGKEDEPENRLEAMQQRLSAYARELRQKKGAQEILRWQLMHHDEKTRPLFKYANARLIQAFQFPASNPAENEDDLEPALAVLIAGIIYLSLMSKHHKYFMGFRLQSEEDWSTLDDTFRMLLAGFVEKETTESDGKPQ